MLLDARTVPSGSIVETDICVVGAGAAGIALAREFVGARHKVVLLESGGLEIEAETQDLYACPDLGDAYPDLTTNRLRFFGGTTNHWGGWCVPLDPIDFEERDWIPHSGWPFDRAHLDTWYRRAQQVCQVGRFEYAPESWGVKKATTPAPFAGPVFVSKLLQVSPPTRFGTVYRQALTQAPNMTVMLHANAMRAELDDSGREVRQLAAGTLTGNRFAIKARAYVFATGGVENARLLLLSREAAGGRLGEDHDLIGRYFNVHLEYCGGVIAVSDPYTNFDFNRPHETKNPFVTFVGLSEQAMRARKLPSIRLTWVYGFSPVHDGLVAAKRLLGNSSKSMLDDLGVVLRHLDGIAVATARKALFGDGSPVLSLTLRASSEVLPNPQSRVVLQDETDALGQRRASLHWYKQAQDKRHALEIHRLLGAEIGRAGFGRLQLMLDESDGRWPQGSYGNEHMMGSTRMHRDPRRGVVDENSRVHGVANLYVAGSSVFPTGGSANPTLTIVALALRLADHLKERVS